MTPGQHRRYRHHRQAGHTPLSLTGRYACRWRHYSQVSLDNGRTAIFRYLLVNVSKGADRLAGIAGRRI